MQILKDIEKDQAEWKAAEKKYEREENADKLNYTCGVLFGIEAAIARIKESPNKEVANVCAECDSSNVVEAKKAIVVCLDCGVHQ